VAEQVALHLSAADRLQHFHLLLRFHAFGRRGHIEIFGEAGNRVHDRKRFCSVGEILNERAVDFDLVKRETAQIAE
jgi:hypothetical protein